MQKFCVIVPAYQEEKCIASVVGGIRKYCETVVVVDDGSLDGTSNEAKKAGAVVLKHEDNKGKGVALNTGFKYAREKGFEFVITMDADGQHDPEEIPRFIEAYRSTMMPVILGNRMDDPKTMPFVRHQTNRFMSWLLSRQMGQYVPDTQCGYRLFKIDAIPRKFFQERAFESDEDGRFAADSEMLLRLAETGIRIGAVPIKIIYRDEKSKINPVKDTIRFFGMLLRYRSRK